MINKCTTRSMSQQVKRRLGTQNFLRQGNVQSRILKRVWNGSEDVARSTTKLWSSHLKGANFTRSQLRLYQKKLIDSIEIPGYCTNTSTEGGINQWYFHNPDPMTAVVKTPVLLIHGYASSSMSFFRNFRGLSSRCRDVYAIDLPSNALSKEIKFTLSNRYDISKLFGAYKLINREGGTRNATAFQIIESFDNKELKEYIREFEDYYIDQIEKWRIENNIGKFHLVGHSFGGYLSFKYSLKYPNSVEKLSLLSPLGVESNIFSSNNIWNEGDILNFNYENPDSNHYFRKLNIPRYIFENQLKILRWGGPMGARLCWNYITSVYSRVPSIDYKEYVFELFYGKGGITPTAMNIFTNLFTRNLLARDPILDSIIELKGKSVMFCYGQHDWMDKRAGKIAINKLNAINKYDNNNSFYLEVPNAGHNLFLDNPNFFNASLISFLSN